MSGTDWPCMDDADDIAWERAMFRLFAQNQDFFDEYLADEIAWRGGLDNTASDRLASLSSDGRRP